MAARHVAEKMKSLDRSTVGILKEASKTARYYVRSDAAGGVIFRSCWSEPQRAFVQKMTIRQIEYRLKSSLDSLSACA